MGRNDWIRHKSVSELLLILSNKRENPDTRWAATEALGAMKSPEVIDALIRALLHDSYRHVRIAAAEVLGRIGDASVISALKEVLYDPDIDVCSEAIQSMKLLGEKDISIYLIRGLDHENPGVRRNALELLWRNGYPNLLGIAIKALEDRYASVSIGAVKVLANLNNVEAVTPLITALNHIVDFWPPRESYYIHTGKWDDSWDMVNAIAGALANLGDTSAIPALIEQLASRQSYQRQAVISALANLGKKDIQYLMDSFKRSQLYDDPFAGMAIVDALEQIGEPALSALEQIAGELKGEYDEKSVADAAKQAIDQIHQK